MTTLFELRDAYREQHRALFLPSRKLGGCIMRTTRRQAHHRPRGRVYVRLLEKEFHW